MAMACSCVFFYGKKYRPKRMLNQNTLIDGLSASCNRVNISEENRQVKNFQRHCAGKSRLGSEQFSYPGVFRLNFAVWYPHARFIGNNNESSGTGTGSA